MRRSWVWLGIVFQLEPGASSVIPMPQLAGLQHIRVDELIDGALIAGLDAAQRTVICISHLDEAGLVRAMCRSGDHIELCRMLGVCGSKR